MMCGEKKEISERGMTLNQVANECWPVTGVAVFVFCEWCGRVDCSLVSSSVVHKPTRRTRQPGTPEIVTQDICSRLDMRT